MNGIVKLWPKKEVKEVANQLEGAVQFVSSASTLCAFPNLFQLNIHWDTTELTIFIPI